MGKGTKAKRNTPASHSKLLIPAHESAAGAPIVDTHTHLLSTYEAYRSKYPSGPYETLYDFAAKMYEGRNVEAIVDVWCEAPVLRDWKEIADASLEEGKWGGTQYHFAMGVHPHHAKDYTDEVETQILEAMAHPRCVAWGEMGLDYHYDNSPRSLQQEVFARQLRHAVRLGKPLTIHTREAEEDTERILKEVVPEDWKIHIHCFTDSPAFAQRLLDHFQNLYIGVTGVITYRTNVNTAETLRNMFSTPDAKLRILLETDAPYMVPSNIYNTISNGSGKLPLSHSAMIPWTAEFVTDVVNEALVARDGPEVEKWDVERVMRVARDNAREMYGV